jgi:GDP-mannose 4,6-dehydratase
LKVLITGITGFVGSHLAEDLLAKHPEVEVHGMLRWRSPKDNISQVSSRVQLHYGDLRDLSSLLRILEIVKPDAISHLAAQSFVTTSYYSPVDTIENNVSGTFNLLEAVRILKQDPTIHICSSSEVYGQVDASNVPITESCPFSPVSPYAVSKVGEDMAAWMYFKAYGLRTIRTRMFTHSGARRGEVFVDSFFAKQISEIEQGIIPPVVRVGNLDSVRTFCDVRDTVRAYWLVITKCCPGEVYNIGGDTTMSIREMLDLLLKMTTYKGQIRVEKDPALIRPADVTSQIPCTTKFKTETGWRPSIPYEETLKDMLEYWRARVPQTASSLTAKLG